MLLLSSLRLPSPEARSSQVRHPAPASRSEPPLFSLSIPANEKVAGSTLAASHLGIVGRDLHERRTRSLQWVQYRPQQQNTFFLFASFLPDAPGPPALKDSTKRRDNSASLAKRSPSPWSCPQTTPRPPRLPLRVRRARPVPLPLTTFSFLPSFLLAV